MHKLYKTIILICALLGCNPIVALAQTELPYKYQKANELLEKEHDVEQALSLMNEQLAETPDQVDCLLLRARIFNFKSEYSAALTDLNRAIVVNKPKKSGMAQSALYWWKASVCVNMGDMAASCDMYAKALAFAEKDDKAHITNIRYDYADALYELDRYAEADAVYNLILSGNDANLPARVGLARNMIARGECKAAVELLEKCVKYAEDYSSTYEFLAKAYDKLGETDKTIDNAIKWLDKDSDADLDILFKACLMHMNYAEAKILEIKKTSENKVTWMAVLAGFYEKAEKYEKAIEAYDALEAEYGKDENTYLRRAMCYEGLGLFSLALSEADKALEISEDGYNIGTKGQILRSAGMYEDAIGFYDKFIEAEPLNPFGYYAKGWCYEMMGNDDKAMEIYNLGIDIDKKHAYSYLMRGNLLAKRGEMEKAKTDFEQVLKLDTLAEDGSCRQYALCFLGRYEEAQQWMEKLIAAEPYDSGYWYDKSCLYARMGKLDESVKALATALEKGYSQFTHIAHDDDMDPIRDRADFKALIVKYSAEMERRNAKYEKKAAETQPETISEIAIKRHNGGTFEVPCTVNGLQLSMIFDTGASDVTISKVEADFMLKNKYLSADDIKGKQYYRVANGEISEGTVITLKEVKIGDALLRNVNASVVKGQQVPLLLGQSVMEKFGTFTVDNINGKLIIKH